MLMSCRVVMTSAFAFGCAVALQAQTQTPASPQTDRTVPSAITLTGCVERAPQVRSGAETAAGTADSDRLAFVLVRAALGSAADSRAAGTSGTKGNPSTPSNTKGNVYRLDADASNLTPHVGHKVEVTGTLDVAATTTTAAAGLDPSSSANAPRLKVDRVKMVAETCDR